MFSSMPGRWLALGFGMLALALFLGNLILLAGAVYLVLVVLSAGVLHAPSGIVASRRLSRMTCWAGDELDVERKLHVDGGMGALYVHDQLPNEADVTGGNNLRVVWKWPGPKTYDLSYSVCSVCAQCVLAQERCVPSAANGLGCRGAAGDARDGQRHRRRRSGDYRRSPHSGHPSGQPDQGQDPYPQSQRRHCCRRLATTDFSELSPYQPGDPMRIVNWKASARNSNGSNPLLVNEYEPAGRKAVWIFMDGADYMDVGTTLSALVDSALEAA